MLRQPAVGVMFWAWIGLMNPHRLTWGYAYTFQFAMLVAVVTFIALVVSREPRQMKGGAAAVVLFFFIAWTCLTTFFALVPDPAVAMMQRVLKIQLFTFVALYVLYKREHITWLIWVIALSIGYYSIKGGLFTIATGGSYIVWGPAESFIEDNNHLALAVVMTIPLWAYLFIIHRQRWVRIGIGAAIVLSTVSAVGSQSRGALLAIVAMSMFLWLKGRSKVLIGAVLVFVAISVVTFMPSSWETRMGTILTYEQDSSAVGRIETWRMLFNLAADRPFTGGGFEPYVQWIADTYNPSYGRIHAAHSIYFAVLGEHGFIALALFLLFWALVWRMCTQVAKATQGKPDQSWAFWLAQMIKVSLIAYLIGGAFLSLAYWDMPYFLFVAIAVARWLVFKAKPELSKPVAVDAVLDLGRGRSAIGRRNVPS